MEQLTAKQIAFIDAYLKYDSVSDICKALNIKRPTYYTYMQNPKIKQELLKRTNQILESTTRYLQKSLNSCSEELIKMIKSDTTPPQTKLNAINSVFNNSNKLTEQLDVIQYIKDVEERLNIEDSKNV